MDLLQLLDLRVLLSLSGENVLVVPQIFSQDLELLSPAALIVDVTDLNDLVCSIGVVLCLVLKFFYGLLLQIEGVDAHSVASSLGLKRKLLVSCVYEYLFCEPSCLFVRYLKDLTVLQQLDLIKVATLLVLAACGVSHLVTCPESL